MKPFKLFLRNLSGFIKRIRFWWEMPNFLTKNKNKGNFHHKFNDKINSPSENVKEIGIKPSKELRVYLEDEELSLLSELNNTTLSQVFHDFPSFFLDFVSSYFGAIYLFAAFSDFERLCQRGGKLKFEFCNLFL